MAKIIRLRGDEPHQEQLLLPWYLTGRLESAERARVEAHLKVCGRCRAELGRERQLEREIADMAPDVERGWAALQARLDEAPSGLPGWLVGAGRGGRRLWRAGGPWIGWAAAASFGALIVAGALSPRPAAVAPEGAVYHTLAAPAPASARADTLVIFRPSAPAQAIAAALRASDARVSDGPTASGAYLLRTPPGARVRALERLRADAAVEIAEPIDQASAP
jgi:hypothetical protein